MVIWDGANKRGIKNYKETIEFLDKLYLDLEIDNNSNYNENRDERELIESLINYITCFNKFVKMRGIKNYKKSIDFINKYFFEMDRKYYSDLEGQPDDMSQLVIYLNEVGAR